MQALNSLVPGAADKLGRHLLGRMLTCLGMARWLQAAPITSIACCWELLSTAVCSQMLACSRQARPHDSGSAAGGRRVGCPTAERQ